MQTIGYIFATLVALEHFYILYLEMFALNSKAAKRTFNLSDEDLTQPKIKTLFNNLGLYNGFLGAGILFSFLIDNLSVTYFFLSCVIVAAIYGAVTANKGILIKQGLPAILAVVFLILGNLQHF